MTQPLIPSAINGAAKYLSGLTPRPLAVAGMNCMRP